jgi:hypothetical protein
MFCQNTVTCITLTHTAHIHHLFLTHTHTPIFFSIDSAALVDSVRAHSAPVAPFAVVSSVSHIRIVVSGGGGTQPVVDGDGGGDGVTFRREGVATTAICGESRVHVCVFCVCVCAFCACVYFTSPLGVKASLRQQ